MAFTFFDSFGETGKLLGDIQADYESLFYTAVVRYGLTGEIVDMPLPVQAAFASVKPNIDSSINNRNNGKKGGRPAKK